MRHGSDKPFSFRAPTGLSERLEEIARKENNKVSSVLRRLLTSAIEREEADRAALARRGKAVQ